MDIKAAELLARSEMDRYGQEDYKLDISYQMSSTFGRCNTQKKVITLSAVLVQLNTREKVLDTIHHEIAHAIREKERGFVPYKLTPAIWHDARWKQIAAGIGASPHQFYNSPGNLHSTVTARVPVPPAWKRICPRCGGTDLVKTRSTKKACAKCYYLTGEYYHFIYESNR